MIAWLLYATMVGVLLGLAAALAEPWAARQGRTRWAWARDGGLRRGPTARAGRGRPDRRAGNT
jgi:hypothetical protein